jgi:hypothetical protein
MVVSSAFYSCENDVSAAWADFYTVSAFSGNPAVHNVHPGGTAVKDYSLHQLILGSNALLR